MVRGDEIVMCEQIRCEGHLPVGPERRAEERYRFRSHEVGDGRLLQGDPREEDGRGDELEVEVGEG